MKDLSLKAEGEKAGSHFVANQGGDEADRPNRAGRGGRGGACGDAVVALKTQDAEARGRQGRAATRGG